MRLEIFVYVLLRSPFDDNKTVNPRILPVSLGDFFRISKGRHTSMSSLDWDTPSALFVVLIEWGLLWMNCRARVVMQGRTSGTRAWNELILHQNFWRGISITGDFICNLENSGVTIKSSARLSGRIGVSLEEDWDAAAKPASAARLIEKLSAALKSSGDRFGVWQIHCQ